MTVIEYKGFRIEVSPVGKGWRAAIFGPASTRAIADSPSNLEKSRAEETLAEAKRIIDARASVRGACKTEALRNITRAFTHHVRFTPESRH